jgi:hypothetical protein
MHSAVCDLVSVNKPGIRTAKVAFTCEVGMQFVRYRTVKSRADVISGILNCVCPQCGGRMGGRGKEFRCQGECLTDWRQAWEQASDEFGMRSRRRVRGSGIGKIPPMSSTDPQTQPVMETRPPMQDLIFAGQGSVEND